MNDIANMQTGELVDYQPIGPIEIEMIIREIGERLENAVPVLAELYNKRYAAERKWIEERAKAMLRSKEATIARQRAEADLAALPFKHQFDDAKEILHAAEHLQKALQSKLYGYLNLNKAHQAAWQGATR
jgi:hypothetical protein